MENPYLEQLPDDSSPPQKSNENQTVAKSSPRTTKKAPPASEGTAVSNLSVTSVTSVTEASVANENIYGNNPATLQNSSKPTTTSEGTTSGISLSSREPSSAPVLPATAPRQGSEGSLPNASATSKISVAKSNSEGSVDLAAKGGQFSSGNDKVMNAIKSDTQWVDEPEGVQDIRKSDPWTEIESRWKIPWKELKFTKKCLGAGYFGKVMEAVWQGTKVACKFIYRDNFRTKNEFDMFVQEVKMLTKLRHPCICQFLGIAVKEQGYCIVSELMYCSLYSFVREDMDLLNSLPKLRWNIAFDIARGINYMHTRNPPILHRDLSSKNVLLQQTSYSAKVADFGLSRSKADSMTRGTGALQWMAPEVFKGRKYTELCDVYSFAIILYELWTGDDAVMQVCAQGEQTLQEYALKISMGVRPPLPGTVPLCWQTLIQQCWHPNPDSRPSFTKVIEVLETFPEASAENLALKTPTNERPKTPDPFLNVGFVNSPEITNNTNNNNGGFIVMDVTPGSPRPQKAADNSYLQGNQGPSLRATQSALTSESYFEVDQNGSGSGTFSGGSDPYLIVNQNGSGMSGGSDPYIVVNQNGSGGSGGSGSTASSY
eukprot:CAMPEP_0168578360 /NCGR_PEP_ID=MMETSP0413-20121227/21288_1 /TAXON_ID=136452 /ORGANISM="Filamoeba nolandi, Strain NC-AS-23-1" /LENGTH=599 /DNA_ID=CAMNT_0008612195 /DNA_START=126 /DNA_END=1925 /DNA_ORIENTATION=-